jgi:hypothetical protein
MIKLAPEYVEHPQMQTLSRTELFKGTFAPAVLRGRYAWFLFLVMAEADHYDRVDFDSARQGEELLFLKSGQSKTMQTPPSSLQVVDAARSLLAPTPKPGFFRTRHIEPNQNSIGHVRVYNGYDFVEWQVQMHSQGVVFALQSKPCLRVLRKWSRADTLLDVLIHADKSIRGSTCAVKCVEMLLNTLVELAQSPDGSRASEILRGLRLDSPGAVRDGLLELERAGRIMMPRSFKKKLELQTWWRYQSITG